MLVASDEGEFETKFKLLKAAYSHQPYIRLEPISWIHTIIKEEENHRILEVEAEKPKKRKK